MSKRKKTCLFLPFPIEKLRMWHSFWPIKLHHLSETSVHDCLTPTVPPRAQVKPFTWLSRSGGMLLDVAWSAWVQLVQWWFNLFQCPPLHSTLGAEKRSRPMLSNRCLQSITHGQRKKSDSCSFPVVSTISARSICFHTWKNTPGLIFHMVAALLCGKTL